MRRFEGKVAIVTGAAQGIGRAYARALAAEGASVVVADVSEQGAAVADEIKGLYVHTDVADPDSVQRMTDAAAERYGGIDYLVNNAAIFGTMRLDFLLTVDWDYYRRFMAVNLDGALLCARAAHPHLVRRGGGAIVNQSSTAAWQYSGFYGLAKAGINGLTQQLAHELGGMGIRVNAIAPGPIDTEANRAVVPTGMVDRIIRDKLALKRVGTPQDLVGMCLFLLSEEAAWVTGQILNVDGGEVFRS
ncbi:SDR family oxidoreductase [Nonomuraea sp. NEAU-A123]|uniref:SDR family oxidoreductase n=1 Tax=Nonomuraea sp. NEAU-A123 TaxID=2839649 RepID=UPI001BE410F1|nr:SDR family oxidoreductase [Nonomuraea sp. NEAU-A123]MBT2233745.1 SDR family oxidoreductase [Nonomuraea sp. NEAU-A123]